MNRRNFALMLVTTGLGLRASDGSTSLRGKLRTGETPSLETGPDKLLALSGDDDTTGVLKDDRLEGTDFEVIGRAKDPTHFDVDRIHTRSLFVHKGGKRLMVTYWCDVCYIRTYTPGKCWCCQKNTDLDLRESISDE